LFLGTFFDGAAFFASLFFGTPATRETFRRGGSDDGDETDTGDHQADGNFSAAHRGERLRVGALHLFQENWKRLANH